MGIRSMKKVFILQTLILAFAMTAFGQNIRKDDIVLYNSSGTARVAAGATITVCVDTAMPGPPCAPLAAIFSDTTGDVLSNPFNADTSGNYFFYAAPGKYLIQISSVGLNIFNYQDVVIPNDPVNPTFGNVTANNLTVTGTCTGCGGGGGGTPVSVNGAAVSNPNFQDSTSVTFAVTGPNVKATAISSSFAGGNVTGATTFLQSMFNCGPSPWTDITCGGARPLVNQITGVASCAATNIITTTTILPLILGDGVVVYGCGPTNTLATPAAPTVTPSLVSGPDPNNDQVASAGGSTSYTYCIVARDTAGGLTACSPPTTITTGVATLGAVQSAVSTLARVNQAVTTTTSAANGAAVGAAEFITNSTDASFSGYFLDATILSGTQFTYNQTYDSRFPIITGNINTGNGYSTNAATGGTAQVYNVNHVVIAPEAGAFQYYICVGPNLVGVTKPGETAWNDHGPTESARGTLPDFVPSVCPSAATNDYLATTVTGGVGTTALIVANSASQTISGQIIHQDNGPNIIAAFTAAALTGKSALRIPATAPNQTFFINSHTILAGSDALEILQSGSITTNEPLDLTGITDSVKHSGRLGGSASSMPQFGFNAGQIIRTNSYPGIMYPSPVSLHELTFSSPAQGAAITIAGTQLFNSNISNSSFLDDSAGDYMGTPITLYGAANTTFDQVLISVNDGLTYGYSLTPSILNRNEIGNANAAGRFTCNYCYFTGRGFGSNGTSVISAQGLIEFNHSYSQAMRSPQIFVGKFSFQSVKINSQLNDTGSSPYVTMFTNQPVTITDSGNVANETAGPPGQISGVPIAGVLAFNTGNALGANRDLPIQTLQTSMSLDVISPDATVGAKLSADYIIGAPMHTQGPYSWYFDAPVPGVVTATGPNSAASTLPTGSWTYRLVIIGPDGGTTRMSTVSSNPCVVTTTNQTCTATWASDGYTHDLWAESGVGGWGKVSGCSGLSVATTTCTQTSTTVGGVVPADTGTGTTIINGRAIYTPMLKQSLPNRWAGTATLAGGTVAVTFPTPYIVPPVCVANDTTALNPVMTSTTTTTLTLTGTGTDVVSYGCFGNPN